MLFTLPGISVPFENTRSLRIDVINNLNSRCHQNPIEEHLIQPILGGKQCTKSLGEIIH